jgi:hypothetical protein
MDFFFSLATKATSLLIDTREGNGVLKVWTARQWFSFARPGSERRFAHVHRDKDQKARNKHQLRHKTPRSD